MNKLMLVYDNSTRNDQTDISTGKGPKEIVDQNDEPQRLNEVDDDYESLLNEFLDHVKQTIL